MSAQKSKAFLVFMSKQSLIIVKIIVKHFYCSFFSWFGQRIQLSQGKQLRLLLKISVLFSWSAEHLLNILSLYTEIQYRIARSI